MPELVVKILTFLGSIVLMGLFLEAERRPAWRARARALAAPVALLGSFLLYDRGGIPTLLAAWILVGGLLLWVRVADR